MWSPRHRRRHAVARRRVLRADEVTTGLGEPVSSVAVRVRQRHRAPTPHLPIAATLPHARRGGLRALAGALVGVAVLVALTALWRAPAFRIHGAQVRGNTRLSAEEVYAGSGLHGAWSLSVDRTAAEQRLAQLPGIRRANVRVTWPARLWIGVEESDLALAWQTAAGMYAVDDMGRIVAPVLDPAHLPIVRDEAGVLTVPDATLPPETFAAARVFATRFGHVALRGDVGFVASTPAGWEVRLGTNAALAEAQARLLPALIDHLSQQGSAVDFIDLRFPTRPYYRLQGGADAS